VVSTYFAEGLPFAIVRQLSSEMLTSMGADPAKITSTSLYGLAWNAKLLWGPLLDRYGTLRRWLVVTEVILGLMVLGLALPAGRGDTNAVWWLLFPVAVVAATHDVAIDGFYLEALDKEGQALFSGLRPAAYRLALFAGKGLLGLAGLLQLAHLEKAAAWRVTFAAAGAGLLLLAGAHALALPKGEAKRAAGPAPDYFDAFATWLKQPRVVYSLLFILLFKTGDQLMFNVNAPFLKSLGLGDLGRATVGSVGLAASIGGSILGGVIIARFGLKRTLAPFAIGQSLAILAYVALATVKPGTAAVGAVAVFEQLAGSVGDAALAVFLLRRCSAPHKAAHFAIGSALMTVPMSLAGLVSGYLLKRVGYAELFMVAFAASLPGVVLTWLVPKD
jgi:PAT family beta-lactamase induction signal transducer AmpG